MRVGTNALAGAIEGFIDDDSIDDYGKYTEGGSEDP